MKLLQITAGAIVLLAGCAMTMSPEGPRSTGAERKYAKNYVVGEKKTVNVGDAMIKFQDYWVERIESPVATPERTVNLKGGTVDITFNAGQKSGPRTLHDGRDRVQPRRFEQ